MALNQSVINPPLNRDQHRPARVEDYFRTVVDLLATGLVVFDHDGHIECVNPAAQQILGVAADDLIHGRGAGTISGCMFDAENRGIGADRWAMARRVRASRRAVGRVVGIDRPDGKRVWLSTSWCLLDPVDHKHSPLLVSFTDITAEFATSQRLAHQANHDALTGLPNRAHVLAKVTQALHASGENALGAILFIDLDNLKVINDTLGHQAGDTALKIVADRLRHAVRPDDLVARLGGDEFVAVLCGSITSAEVDRLSERLHTVLSEPATIGGATVRLGASVGIAEVRPDDDRDAAELLRDADLAMYSAKKSGRGRSRRFAEQPREYAETTK
jgi:diguanylate cyclase (GGDEF)-like protein/PAS domain S-box-containing protein